MSQIAVRPYARHVGAQAAQVNPGAAGVETGYDAMATLAKGLAPGLEQMGVTLAKLKQDEEDGLLADTLLQAQKDTMQLEFDIKQEPDPDRALAMQASGEKLIADQATAALKDRPALQRQFRQKFDVFALNRKLDMAEGIIGKQKNFNIAGIERDIRDSSSLYNLDAINNQIVTASLESRVEQAEKTGVISPLQRESYLTRIRTQVEPEAWKNHLFSLADQGRAAEAVAILDGATTGQDPYAFVAGKESNNNSTAIGYDSTGGTSYGMFQVSSSTMEKIMLPWLEEKGMRAAAHVLRDAGPANSGGKGGAMAEAWRGLVERNVITPALERQFIQETHVLPALEQMPPNITQAILSDPGLHQALISTAVQHGSGPTAEMFSSNWGKAGGDRNAFINALYADRSTRFGSSTEGVRASVQARLAKERDEILGMNGEPAGDAAARIREVLPAGEVLALRAEMQRQSKEQQSLAKDQAAAATFNGILKDVSPFSPEVQDMRAAELIDALPPGEVQSKVRKDWEAQKKIRDEAIETKDAALAASLLADMRENNLNGPAATQHLATLKANGMSDKGIDTLRKRLESGELDKETPANKTRANDGYKMIDDGAITTPEQVDVLSFNANLTKGQTDGLKNYLNAGGSVGAASELWSRLDKVYKEMLPGSKGLQENPDFMPLFLKSADMEKLHREGDTYIRRQTANLLTAGKEGGGAIWDTSMPYSEAVRRGVSDKWYPEVTAEEERRYQNIFTSMGRVYNSKAEWRQAIRDYKKYDVMGLPRPQQTREQGQ